MSTNANDDPPPYLLAGTEVSAKFKGAFCEAKITRVDKTVKCKLTYKNTNEQVTVNDTQLKNATGQPLAINEFKIGSIVYVSKTNSNDNLQPATLNKVNDQSVYTVVFNDGDEKAMKRSFIRFKGEKHYLDSETLNNAPLNNPEHFLYPIKNSSDKQKANLNASDNDTDNESSSAKNEHTDEKKVKDEPNDEDEDDNSIDNVSTSSDECPPEEKDRFVAQLYKFMDDRGTPMNRIPSINKTDIDLHKLFTAVKKLGGFNKVTKQRSWIDVYKKLGLPNCHNSANILNLKSAYERYLHPYEEISRKLGGNMMCDLVSGRHASSVSGLSKRTATTTDSQRSNNLFKRQVITPSTASTTTPTPKRATNSKSKQTKQMASTPAPSKEEPIEVENSATEAKMKRSASIDDNLNDDYDQASNKEITIDSLINNTMSNLHVTSSVASSGGSNDDQQQQPQEETLTLFSMVRNLNETYKKAKKQEKEKKQMEDNEWCSEIEDRKDRKVLDTSSDDKEEKNSKKKSSSSANNSASSKKGKSGDLNTDKQSSSTPQNIKSKATSNVKSYSIDSKASINVKNEPENVDDMNDLDDEPNPKKKSNRLSLSLNEESSSSSSNNQGNSKSTLGCKRKTSMSTSKGIDDKNIDSENDKDTSSQDGNTNIDSNSANDINTDVDLNEGDYKTNLVMSDIEINRMVDVKYGNTNQKQLYRAKIVQVNTDNQTILVHYLGWNNRYDEWVKLDRIIRMLNEDSNAKRRKTIKASNSTTSSSSNPLSSSSETTQSKSTKDAKSSESTLPKGEKSVIKTLKLTKRSSLSNSSSTSSIADQVLSLKEECTNSNEQLNTNDDKGSIKTPKTRNSDSTLSNSSILVSKRRSFDDAPKLSTFTTCSPSSLTIASLQTTSKEASSDPLIQKMEINTEFESANESEKSAKMSTLNKANQKDLSPEYMSNVKELPPQDIEMNSLLSIKEEIMEYDTTQTNFAIHSISLRASLSPSRIAPVKKSNSTSSVDFNKITSITSNKNEENSSVNTPSPTTIPKEHLFNKTEDMIASKSTNDESNIVEELSSVSSDAAKKSSTSNKNSSSTKSNQKTNSKSNSKYSSPSSKKESQSELKSKNEQALGETNDQKENSSTPNEQPIPASNDVLEKEIATKPEQVINDCQKNTIKANEQVKHEANNKSIDSQNNESVNNLNKSQDIDQEKNSTNNSNVSNSNLKKNETTVLNTIQTDSKYSFHIINTNLCGKQRIRHIEEQMKLCREAYAKLKNEIASIDRKKKKLKRNLLDKSSSNTNINHNTNNNYANSNNNHSSNSNATNINYTDENLHNNSTSISSKQDMSNTKKSNDVRS